MRTTIPRLVLVPALLLAAWPPAASADWLVTRDGARIETDGPWEVRGRSVIFTLVKGPLSSMRLSEVDLEASRAATDEAARPAPPPPTDTAPRPPILRLTDEDVGRGEGGVTGPAVLIERLRRVHGYQDVASAMGLFNFQDTPAGFRGFIEKQLEWLMGRRIRNVVLTEVDPGETIEQVHDGVAYEPNVEVSHRMTIELVPDNDDERLSLEFYVGTRLGSYYIAAARPASNPPDVEFPGER